MTLAQVELNREEARLAVATRLERAIEAEDELKLTRTEFLTRDLASILKRMVLGGRKIDCTHTGNSKLLKVRSPSP